MSIRERRVTLAGDSHTDRPQRVDRECRWRPLRRRGTGVRCRREADGGSCGAPEAGLDSEHELTPPRYGAIHLVSVRGRPRSNGRARAPPRRGRAERGRARDPPGGDSGASPRAEPSRGSGTTGGRGLRGRAAPAEVSLTTPGHPGHRCRDRGRGAGDRPTGAGPPVRGLVRGWKRSDRGVARPCPVQSDRAGLRLEGRLHRSEGTLVQPGGVQASRADLLARCGARGSESRGRRDREARVEQPRGAATGLAAPHAIIRSTRGSSTVRIS